MTVTITITDPTADESRAVRAYLDALHGGTAGDRGTTPRYDPTAQVATIRFEEQIEVPVSDESTTATSAEDAGAPDFDSAGMPWDERIHASSRATVADGTWRKKRGVSDELVAEVEAELAHGANLTASDGELLEQAEPIDVPEVPEAPAPVQAPEVPAAPDSPPPPPAATPNPFLAVMSRIGKSKLDKAKKDELLTAAGALDDKGNPSILVLNKRPELIDGFVALLDSEGV